ncbi:MAG: hypothetical protein ACKO34_05255 [Vampirovibrionales bacterium]
MPLIDKHLTHPHDLPQRRLKTPKQTDRSLLGVYLGIFILLYFVVSSLINVIFHS